MKTRPYVLAVLAVLAILAAPATASSETVPTMDDSATPPPSIPIVQAIASDAACALGSRQEPVEASWQEEYGTCTLYCGENFEPYPVGEMTQDECCSQLHLCPDGSYPAAKQWEPYVGWPVLCQT